MMTLFRIAACFPIVVGACKLVPGLHDLLGNLGDELSVLGLGFSAAYVGAEVYIWRTKALAAKAERARKEDRRKRAIATKAAADPAK